jgi:Mannosyl-glycoprotein endo-beta-N-acetylglucosaminidase
MSCLSRSSDPSASPITRGVRRCIGLGLLALVVTLAACSPVKQQAPGAVPVMGTSDLTAEQIAAFFWANQPPGSPCLNVSVEDLSAYFVWEGNVENVRGDIAFAQSIVETGWFRYGGQVQCGQNNYAGIGATDGGPAGATFPDADTGVRAQIQHLRAYADPSATSCTQPPLHTPCVDPRFDMVSPKGKAPVWNQMGNGNWATSSAYASNVLNLYNRMRTSAGLPPV